MKSPKPEWRSVYELNGIMFMLFLCTIKNE